MSDRVVNGALLACGVAVAIVVMVLGMWDRRPVLVCFGDSLTTCGGPSGRYSDWLQRFLPHVRVINAGVSGDTLLGGRQRFARDVLSRNPDVIIIALGANDFWKRDRPVEALRADLEAMVSEARSRGCAVALASCFGDRAFWEETSVEFEASRFQFAWEIAQMERAVSVAHGCWYVPNMQVDIKPNRLPPFWDKSDHPGPQGNEQVALRLLPAAQAALAERAAGRK